MQQPFQALYPGFLVLRCHICKFCRYAAKAKLIFEQQKYQGHDKIAPN